MPTTRPHPYLMVTREPAPGLRSLEELRAVARHPRIAERFDHLRRLVEESLSDPPVAAHTPLPGRSAASAERGEMDVMVTLHLKRRLSNAALAAMVWQEPAYAQAAYRQIEALLDPAQWPTWSLSPHLPVDLRIAATAQTLALCYDWLHPMLSPEQRLHIEQGLDERAIQPFLITMRERRFPCDRRSNWCSTVIGGVGVAAMALADVNPHAAEIIAFSRERLDWLIGVYGPEGEFNESPGYADVLPTQLEYFLARESFSRGNDPLPRVFEALTRWTLYAIAPPGHYVNHGDSGGGQWRYWFLPAVARAFREPTVQWFYEAYAKLAGLAPRALELMTYDPTVEGVAPADAGWPLGRAYRAWGALASSRSSWDLAKSRTAVFAKCSIEMGHEHNDAGQVLLFGHGQELLVDDMHHSYPDDYWEAGRYGYLFASAEAHNILTFGHHVPRYGYPTTVQRGRLLESGFDPARGGGWTMDLSEPERGLRVRRTVIHALPSLLAVLDEAECDQEEEIVLRWHTGQAPAVSAVPGGGRFTVERRGVRLAAQVVRLDGENLAVSANSWPVPPEVHDRHRNGRLPFVQAAVKDRAVRLLSLFTVYGPDEPAGEWRFDRSTGASTIAALEGERRVRVDERGLVVLDAAGQVLWEAARV